MGAKMGGASPEADPGVLRRGERQSYSKNASEKQGRKAAADGVTYQRVTGDIGPVSVLAKRGCPPPAVVVERGPTRAQVWIEHAPWGWPHGLREFLDPASPSVLRYAQRLALKLRESALIEQGRRVRNRELARLERERLLDERRGR